jgi:opacity protein-like surface antigen
VEESLGGGASLRAGWMWDNFFADFHFTYARSDLESIELGGLNPSFSGDTEFFGFHLTGGGKVDLLDDLKLPFGFGVGGGRQEISMTLDGVPISESDFVLTHHLFAGLEYFATEHLLFGMRYRLVNLGEMNIFSKRALQMLEFSCGYQY